MPDTNGIADPSHTTGVCGTDGHIHEGEFISTFPVRDRLGFDLTTIETIYSRGHVFPSNSSYPVTKPLAPLSSSARMLKVLLLATDAWPMSA